MFPFFELSEDSHSSEIITPVNTDNNSPNRSLPQDAQTTHHQFDILVAIAKGVSTVVALSTVMLFVMSVLLAKTLAVNIAQSRGLGFIIVGCASIFGFFYLRWGVSGWVILGAMDM